MFDTSTVSGVRTFRDNLDLLVSWQSSAPAGTYFQVYLDTRLVWHGTSRSCQVQRPSTRSTLHVGTVLASEIKTDFGSTLTSIGGSGNRVILNWTGGTYLDSSGNDDVLGFRVYQGTTPGGAVDRSKWIGDVAAYPAGVLLDGHGLGRHGMGAHGRADSEYSWTSGPLSGGTWNFQLCVYGSTGIEGTALALSQAVAAPPNPPAESSPGQRLTYTYDPGTRVVTLNWNAPLP